MNPRTVVIALAVVLSSAAQSQSSYTVQDIGTLPNTDVSRASDVNDSGWIVGTTVKGSSPKDGFFWSPGSGMIDMGFVPNQMLRLNNLGHVIEAGQGWVWKFGDNGNSRLMLPSFRAGGTVAANGLDDAGEICGISETDVVLGTSGGQPVYEKLPTVWKQVGTAWSSTALPLPPGDNLGNVLAMTNPAPDGSGQAVGLSAVASFPGGVYTLTAKRVVRWARSGDVWSVIATFDVDPGASVSFTVVNSAGYAAGGDPNSGPCYFVDAGSNQLLTPSANGATGIDSLGNICMSASLPEGKRAVRRDVSTGAIVSLGALAGGTTVPASQRAMSPSGQVVGSSLMSHSRSLGDIYDAFLWSASTGMQDLNATALTPNKGAFSRLGDCAGISATGYIAGSGPLKKGGLTHAYRLVPNP